MLKKGKIYRNKKTGNCYIVRGFACNANNDVLDEDRGLVHVIYHRTDPVENDVWFRKVDEFKEKFEPFKINGEHIGIDQVFKTEI